MFPHEHAATVVVIDDHDIVRFGLETLVQACPELRCAGSAPTSREGLELIAGYLMKETAHALVIPAALMVLQGGTWVSPRLNAKLLNRFLHRARPAPVGLTHEGEMELTARETEVLQLLRSGRTSKEIAAAPGLSTRTVDIHRASIKRKSRAGVRRSTPRALFPKMPPCWGKRVRPLRCVTFRDGDPLRLECRQRLSGASARSEEFR